MTELAHQLGSRNFAEYVENEDVLAQVRALNIGLAQGFHIGRPEPLGTRQLASRQSASTGRPIAPSAT